MARYGYEDRDSYENVFGDRMPATRKYVATSESPDDTLGLPPVDGKQHYRAARVRVDKPAEMELSDPKLIDEGELLDEFNFRADLNNRLEDTVSKAEKEQLTSQQSTTPQMIVSRPGKIAAAFSDRSMQHSAGKLFGMVFDDFKGHRMIADEDLSSHSSKLVQKASDAGLVETHPSNREAAVTNSHGFEAYTTNLGHAPNQRPIEQVNFAAKALMRRLGRRQTQQTQQPNYEQLTLPFDGDD